MKQILFLMGLLLASTVAADEAAPVPQPRDLVIDQTTPAQPTIIFPTLPVLDEKDVPPEDQPAPPPRPHTPKFISELSEETWLVIESPEPLLITSSPLGHVAIQPEVGPVRVRGKFADGTGKVETRVFKSANLYFINAISPGKVEILIYHSKLTEEKDIPRYTLTIMGQSPIPPPDPKPKPGPEPAPEPDTVKAENIRVCIIEDVMNRSPETAAVLNSLVGWTAFADAGNQYRLYDKSTKEPAGVAAVAAAGTTPLPAMVVYDNKTGALITSTALPGSFSGFKTIVEGLVK